MIRVLIADDQMLVRQGIRTLLEMDREIAVVSEAADGSEAVARVLATAVDVLLLQFQLVELLPHRHHALPPADWMVWRRHDKQARQAGHDK